MSLDRRDLSAPDGRDSQSTVCPVEIFRSQFSSRDLLVRPSRILPKVTPCGHI